MEVPTPEITDSILEAMELTSRFGKYIDAKLMVPWRFASELLAKTHVTNAETSKTIYVINSIKGINTRTIANKMEMEEYFNLL